MLTGIDFSSFGFGDPLYLWLLAAPAMLFVLWVWQVRRRRRDVRRCVQERVLPVRERYTVAGDLAFWCCLLIAVSLCIVALARPQARVTVVRGGGADFVILQDGSASMYVNDVPPDRWQRSIQFVRTFAETLSWQNDRVALALFAHRAAPQVRLTRDPNALFFFLEHLAERSPFRLEDDPTWGTNIEEGVRWGLNLVETNEELFGKTNNSKAFVVISDGQAWSGTVQRALADAVARDVTVHVVGVGTTAGAFIPEVQGPDAPVNTPPSEPSSTATRFGRSRVPAAASISKSADSLIGKWPPGLSAVSDGEASPARRRKRAKSSTGSSFSRPRLSSV